MQQYVDFIKQYKYLYALTLLIIFYILSKLVVVISRKFILKLTKRTKTDIDDLIIKRTNKPISIILLLIGIRLALLPLGIRQNILDIVEHIISSFIIVTITYIVIAIFDILIDNWSKRVAEKTKSTIDDQLIPVFHRFSRVFI
jgi:MscS family membrane protein